MTLTKMWAGKPISSRSLSQSFDFKKVACSSPCFPSPLDAVDMEADQESGLDDDPEGSGVTPTPLSSPGGSGGVVMFPGSEFGPDTGVSGSGRSRGRGGRPSPGRDASI
jgi:hypothetical protein